MAGSPDISKGSIDAVIGFSFSFCALLVVAYFKYESSSFFRNFADLFIGISFRKRTKSDLLLFAVIPLFIGLGFLLLRFV